MFLPNCQSRARKHQFNGNSKQKFLQRSLKCSIPEKSPKDRAKQRLQGVLCLCEKTAVILWGLFFFQTDYCLKNGTQTEKTTLASKKSVQVNSHHIYTIVYVQFMYFSRRVIFD